MSISGKRISVIGYGSQGRAHALNLRDGGFDVAVGLRKDGASWRRAVADGWQPFEPSKAAQRDVVMMLVPDEEAANVYKEHVAPSLQPGAALGFAHGFAVHFGYIVPPPDVAVFMVAPKGPGALVRSEFKAGRGVPCLIAVHRDPRGDAARIAHDWARALGADRAGILSTTFREETETDLFGEQAVLCGGVTELVRAGFETLTEAGYAPEMAYFECLHELKLIVDLIYERGIEGMRDGVSNTAKYGDYTRGPKIITAQTRAAMRQVLEAIRTGEFAHEWMAECRAGKPHFRDFRRLGAAHPIEHVGRQLRALMPWLPKARSSVNGRVESEHVPEVGAFLL
jgi:ketol-acid reductoisomerase